VRHEPQPLPFPHGLQEFRTAGRPLTLIKLALGSEVGATLHAP
jgi:hypothetical protein